MKRKGKSPPRTSENQGEGSGGGGRWCEAVIDGRRGTG